MPLRGLAPRCPAATDWTALIMFGWRERVGRLVPGVTTHDYVDDWVAHMGGGSQSCAARVSAIAVSTAEFAAALQLRSNDDRSVRFASAASARALLRRHRGLPVAVCFHDLGVDQQVGVRRRKAPLENKVQSVRVRFERCAQLALPWDGRMRVAAASGIAAAAYGAPVGQFAVCACTA